MRSRRSGRWLVCQTSCPRDRAGRREVTRLIAEGAGTAEIARRMHLSVHTVRDDVKAVLEKVGVSSRGELVATLFSRHYAPVHLGAGAREAARGG